MTERNTSEELSKSRSALGDLTNQLGKRGFYERGKNGIGGLNLNDNNKVKRPRISPSQFTWNNSLKHKVLSSTSKVTDENRDSNVLDVGSGYSILKSSDGKSDLNYKLKSCAAVSQIVDELGGSDSGKTNICGEHVCNLGGDSARQTKEDGGEITLGCAKLCNTDEPVLLDFDSCVAQFVNIEANKESGDSFPTESSMTMVETGSSCLNSEKICDADEAKVSLACTKSGLNYENDSDYHNGDGFVLSQSGSIDCSNLPESQESRVFELEKSIELKKGDACANMSGFVDSIKACSCSFCTKAAHIWLDLNYQDIKARVSAMTRIQREAIILTERIGKSRATEKHVAESFTRVPSLEYNLRQQWRSLFQNMAGIWEKEGNQLEASLLPISELREKLKSELELIATPSEKN